MTEEDKKKQELFLEQLMQNQTRIYAFILSLVRNYQDADDILQDTAKTMWEKYEESQPVSNFMAWGNQIAYYKVLDHRKKERKAGLSFDNQLFEKILPIAEEASANTNDRFDKLNNCLKKLKPRAKKLIQLRYYQDLKPKQIATLLGLSMANIYKIMSRIHGQLLECIGNN